MRKPQKTMPGPYAVISFNDIVNLEQVVGEIQNSLGRSLTFTEIMEIKIDPRELYFYGIFDEPPVENLNYEEQMREYELQKKIQDARNVISNTSPSKIIELENQIKNAKKDREKALETLKELGIEENYHNLVEKS